MEGAPLTPPVLGSSALPQTLKGIRRAQVAGVVVGEGFRFGYRAAGDCDALRALGAAAGLRVAVADLVDAGEAGLAVKARAPPQPGAPRRAKGDGACRRRCGRPGWPAGAPERSRAVAAAHGGGGAQRQGLPCTRQKFCQASCRRARQAGLVTVSKRVCMRAVVLLPAQLAAVIPMPDAPTLPALTLEARAGVLVQGARGAGGGAAAARGRLPRPALPPGRGRRPRRRGPAAARQPVVRPPLVADWRRPDGEGPGGRH